jgi:hypothetical protein
MESSSSRATALILLTTVVVLISVVLFVNIAKPSVKSVESYANDLPLTNFNTFMSNMGCMRDITFPYQASSTLSVSERAVQEPGDASCPMRLDLKQPSDDLFQVTEGLINYNLKYKCFNLPVKYAVVKGQDNNTVRLTFDASNINSIKELILLNPLFVELNGSTAYVPVYNEELPNRNQYWGVLGFAITNWKGGIMFKDSNSNDVSINFRVLLSNTGGLQYSKNTSKFSVNNMSFPTTISCTAYYLDIQNASSYNYAITYNSDQKTRVNAFKIFDVNYFSNIPTSMVTKYFFNQKIDIILKNNIMPVFTFNFSFNLTKNKSDPTINASYDPNDKYHEIYRVFMDTPFGEYSTSTYYFRPMDNVRNMNIASCFVHSWANLDTFCLTTIFPTQQTGQPLSMDGPALRVELPYALEKETFDVTLTLTPYDKIAYVQWRDTSGNNNYILKRSAWCARNNLFNNIFTNLSTSGNRVGDIYVKYDNFFVTNTEKVMLGYRNFNDF